MGATTIVALLLEALQVARQAAAILKQAQDEKWAANDLRWEEKFAELDAELERARRRLI